MGVKRAPALKEINWGQTPISSQIASLLEARSAEVLAEGCTVENIHDEARLGSKTATLTPTLSHKWERE